MTLNICKKKLEMTNVRLQLWDKDKTKERYNRLLWERFYKMNYKFQEGLAKFNILLTYYPFKINKALILMSKTTYIEKS